MPEGHPLRLDAGARAAPEQGHERDLAGTRLVEARRLRRTRIHGRHREVRGDVAKRMAVADREVVEPALDARIPADREVRLEALDIEGAAMNATDAEPWIAGLARRKGHCEIELP